MGHAGAIISGGKGTAAEKMAVMKKSGIKVVESPAELGSTMLKAIEGLKKKKASKPKTKSAAKSKKVVKKIAVSKPKKAVKKTTKKKK